MTPTQIVITTETLKAFCPQAVPFLEGLQAAAKWARIDTPLRARHFLAQCAHESQGFTRTVENLNYSAAGMIDTWPSRFRLPLSEAEELMKVFPDGKANAEYCHRNPERVANYAYGNWLGNASPESGDGWAFRGRGLIQLTGRENFGLFSRSYFGDDRAIDNPALLEGHHDAALSAAWFWRVRGINVAADDDSLEAVTRRINPALKGLVDRREWLKRAASVFV